MIRCFINDCFEELVIRDKSLITYWGIVRFSIHRRTILINKKIYAKYNPFKSIIEIEMKRKKALLLDKQIVFQGKLNWGSYTEKSKPHLISYIQVLNDLFLLTLSKKIGLNFTI